jgi:hypothetical protein
VTTSIVEQQVEEQPTAEEPPSVEAPSVESTTQAPPVQREAPKSVVTTTIEVPVPKAGSDGEGS